MKKVLFSSVCAVALLGSNVYAIESNSVGNSLDSFLSQKDELVKNIGLKQEEINNKNQALEKLKLDAETNRALITEAIKAITQANLNLTNKEGELNAVNSHKTILDKEKLDLDVKKTSLDGEIANLNTSIADLESKLAELTIAYDNGQTDLNAKKQSFDTAKTQLDAEKLKVEYDKKQQAYNDAIKKLDEINIAGKDDERLAAEEAQRKAKQELDEAFKTIEPLTATYNTARQNYLNALDLQEKNFNNIEQNKIETEKIKNSLELKTQELNGVSTQITTNTQKLSEVQTALTTAQANLEQAKKTLEEKQLAKQNQEAKTTELDLEVGKAKQDLLTAQAELDKLNQDLKELEGNIANNTEVGKKSKEEMGENYKASTQELANKLITLSAENNGDLSTATPEVKAQAQAIANSIANTIINEQKSEISSDVLSSLNVSINNMNKRLGEIRGLNEDLGVWFRAYGGRFSNDNSHFNYYSTQIGADKKTDFNNGDLIAGALFGYDKVNSNAKSKGFNIGGYLSYISNDGYFADLVLKYIHTGYDKAGIKSQNSFLASVESGYRFNVYQNTYLEPSLELITGYVGKYEAQIGKNTISTKSYVPLIIKPQVFAGYSVNDFTFRAGVGAILDTKKHTANILISDIVKGINANASTKLDSNNRGFVNLGGSYKFNDNLRLNLSVERSFGSSLTNDYEINSTIRYTF